jgi:hypothetical protein
MKNVFFLVGLSIPILLSMTFREADAKTGYSPQIVFSVPIKPKATIIIEEYQLSKYLKKGYQVQQMVHTYNGYLKFCMVKY